MIVVPAGSFPMGVPEGARDGGRDEYPRHDVFIDTFAIDTFEVTNGRYLEFVKSTGHRVPHNPRNPTRNFGRERTSRIRSPSDQSSTSIGLTPRLIADGQVNDCRLKPNGRKRPKEHPIDDSLGGMSNRLGKHLNYNQPWIGEKTLMPVGSYEAGKSPYGLYDMAGNVWEWVNDWYDAQYYEKSPKRIQKVLTQAQRK